MTSEEYLDKRNKTAKEIWLAEYQQQPVDILGRMFAQLETIEDHDFRKIKNQIEGCIA